MSWLLGCLALLFVTSSGLGRYMPAMFSMHMADHMMLSMLVPILLVLGGPVSLALRALPTAGRDDPPGMREWLLAALHSRLSRFLTNPIVATVLFIAGFYGLYLGGLFDAAVGSHMGHVAMNVHFLVSGYLFYWVVIGVDPTPRPIPPLAKVAVVFASLPLHAFFGVLLMSMQNVLGGELLPVAAPELAHRPAGRSAARRRNRLGGRGNTAGRRDDRVACAMDAQRPANRASGWIARPTATTTPSWRPTTRCWPNWPAATHRGTSAVASPATTRESHQPALNHYPLLQNVAHAISRLSTVAVLSTGSRSRVGQSRLSVRLG